MRDGRPQWMIEKELTAVWDGTRNNGRNPSLYAIGKEYKAPIAADPSSKARISMERGATKDLIIEYLEEHPEGTVSEIAASAGAVTSKDYQRINVMAWKLKEARVINCRKEQRYNDRGRAYRCHVYSMPGRARAGLLSKAA